MTCDLVRRLEVDDADHGTAALRPVQDVHRIQIDVHDADAMKVAERSGDFDGGHEIADHPGRHPLRRDRRRERVLVEQRHAQIHPAIAQAPVRLQEREIPRVRQRLVDGRQRGDLVDEILLIDQPGLRCRLDEDVGPAARVAGDVKLMPYVLDRRVSTTLGIETLDAPELIEGRERAVEIECVRHRLL